LIVKGNAQIARGLNCRPATSGAAVTVFEAKLRQGVYFRAGIVYKCYVYEISK